jgi:hypothetical protein
MLEQINSQWRVPRVPLPKGKSMINEKGFSETINDSLKVTNVPLSLRTEDVDATAQYLADKFRNPGGLKFYQKVAWYIPRGTIDRLVALAFERGSDPARYFTALANKELGI